MIPIYIRVQTTLFDSTYTRHGGIEVKFTVSECAFGRCRGGEGTGRLVFNRDRVSVWEGENLGRWEMLRRHHGVNARILRNCIVKCG